MNAKFYVLHDIDVTNKDELGKLQALITLINTNHKLNALSMPDREERYKKTQPIYLRILEDGNANYVKGVLNPIEILKLVAAESKEIKDFYFNL